MTPTIRTTSLILAAFALVGLMTTGAVAAPAFAQTAEWLNTITDATETENETTEQTLIQNQNQLINHSTSQSMAQAAPLQAKAHLSVIAQVMSAILEL